MRQLCIITLCVMTCTYHCDCHEPTQRIHRRVVEMRRGIQGARGSQHNLRIDWIGMRKKLEDCNSLCVYWMLQLNSTNQFTDRESLCSEQLRCLGYGNAKRRFKLFRSDLSRVFFVVEINSRGCISWYKCFHTLSNRSVMAAFSEIERSFRRI